MYHEGGRVDTDTPEMAAARAEISAIQRRHRVERRHGEEPSQTPTISGLLRQQQPDDADDGLPRPPRGRTLQRRTIIVRSSLSRNSLAWTALHVAPPPRDRRRSRTVVREVDPALRGVDALVVARVVRPPAARNPVGRPSRANEPPPRDLDEPGPRFSGDDQESPLSPEDVAIKREFDEALAAEKMQRCPRCKERWFDVKLMGDGICKRCHNKDDKRRQDEPFFFSAANNLDFGSVPVYLPKLEPLEELFIVRVHVSVNVYTVCDTSLWQSLLANTL